MSKRFRVAFSFAGEKRDFVAQVALILANRFGEAQVLYDKFHEAEFARPRLGFVLPALYCAHSDLIVAILCENYGQKEWCGLEWDAIFSHIKKGHDEYVLLSRFDHVDGKGLFGLAGFIELDRKTPAEFADRILERLARNEDQPKDYYKTPRFERAPALAASTAATAPALAQPQIQIKSARFGANGLDKSGWVDVTERVQELIGDGSGQIYADTSHLHVADPIYGVRKRLEIQYTVQGRRVMFEIWEDETASLPTVAPRISAYDIECSTDFVQIFQDAFTKAVPGDRLEVESFIESLKLQVKEVMSDVDHAEPRLRHLTGQGGGRPSISIRRIGQASLDKCGMLSIKFDWRPFSDLETRLRNLNIGADKLPDSLQKGVVDMRAIEADIQRIILREIIEKYDKFLPKQSPNKEEAPSQRPELSYDQNSWRKIEHAGGPKGVLYFLRVSNRSSKRITGARGMLLSLLRDGINQFDGQHSLLRFFPAGPDSTDAENKDIRPGATEQLELLFKDDAGDLVIKIIEPNAYRGRNRLVPGSEYIMTVAVDSNEAQRQEIRFQIRTSGKEWLIAVMPQP